MEIQGITEKRNLNSILYMLDSQDIFFETGYKVLKAQEKKGFIKCNRVTYNGKDTLLYSISEFKSLAMMMPLLNQSSYITILANLIEVILEVKNNGFMQFENIDLSYDNIFIDSNNYKVYLIYIPLATQTTPEKYMIFEKQLRDTIISMSNQYPNVKSACLASICNQLSIMSVSLGYIKDFISESLSNVMNDFQYVKDGGTDSYSMPMNEKLVVVNQADNYGRGMGKSATASARTRDEQVNVKQTKKHGLLFGRKKNKEEQPKQNTNPKKRAEGGATEVLGDAFVPSIMVLGINTPEKIQLIITKPEYKIGKKESSVDGLITFNNTISREHCKIVQKNNNYYIVDMSSANGTYVNGIRIKPNIEMAISPGDKIRLSNSDFIIQAV